MNGLEKEFGGALLILRVDIFSPAGRELTRIYGSRVTPTFILFGPAGQEIWRRFGTIDPDQIRASLLR